MTDKKLDFELEEVDSNLILSKEVMNGKSFYYFVVKKLKKLCQAVDDINERLKDIESRQRIEETISSLDSNSIQDKLEQLSKRLDNNILKFMEDFNCLNKENIKINERFDKLLASERENLEELREKAWKYDELCK